MPLGAAQAMKAANVMAASAKTFHGAARLLPRNIRHDVQMLYAFCRSVDDLADESGRDAKQAGALLACVEEELTQSGGGSASARLGWYFAPGNVLLSSAAAALVRTARTDLAQQQPQDAAALEEYAFGVAGTVGLMMAELCKADRRGLRAAISLGVAMQLTNIVRDVAADLRNRRVYLPAEWVPAGQVRRALELRDASAQDELRRVTRRVLGLAETRYQQAYAGMWALPWRTRWSILAAAMCYRQIGVLVGRDIDASWQRRTVVSRRSKLGLLLLAGVRLLLPRFWLAPHPVRQQPALEAQALRRCQQQAAR